jgi:hypothetical protein
LQQEEEDNRVVGWMPSIRERDEFQENNSLTQANEISEDSVIPNTMRAGQKRHSASSFDSDADVMNRRPVKVDSSLNVQDCSEGLSTLDEVMRQSPKAAQKQLNESISSFNWE